MTTKAGFRRARRPEQKRQRYAAILDAARELALREWDGVVSLADIAARVGMHKSALLKYFDTREEIFLRLAEPEIAEWSAGVLAALSVADREPHEVADVLAGSVADRPLLCQLLLFAPLTLERKVSPDAVRAFKLAMRASMEQVVPALQRAIPALDAEGCHDLVMTTGVMAAGLWQAAHPSPQVQALY